MKGHGTLDLSHGLNRSVITNTYTDHNAALKHKLAVVPTISFCITDVEVNRSFEVQFFNFENRSQSFEVNVIHFEIRKNFKGFSKYFVFEFEVIHIQIRSHLYSKKSKLF